MKKFLRKPKFKYENVSTAATLFKKGEHVLLESGPEGLRRAPTAIIAHESVSQSVREGISMNGCSLVDFLSAGWPGAQV